MRSLKRLRYRAATDDALIGDIVAQIQLRFNADQIRSIVARLTELLGTIDRTPALRNPVTDTNAAEMIELQDSIDRFHSDMKANQMDHAHVNDKVTRAETIFENVSRWNANNPGNRLGLDFQDFMHLWTEDLSVVDRDSVRLPRGYTFPVSQLDAWFEHPKNFQPVYTTVTAQRSGSRAPLGR